MKSLCEAQELMSRVCRSDSAQSRPRARQHGYVQSQTIMSGVMISIVRYQGDTVVIAKATLK